MNLNFDAQRGTGAIHRPPAAGPLWSGVSTSPGAAGPSSGQAGADQGAAGADSPAPPAPTKAPPTPEQRRRRLLLLGGGIGFVAILGIMLVVVFFVLGSDGSKLPAEVGNPPVLWLRADALSETSSIGSWRSSAGNLDAHQSVAGARPTWQANAIGERPAVAFDGTDDTLEVALNIHPATLSNVTFVAVFTSRTEAKDKRRLYGSDDGEFDRAAGLDDRGFGRNYTVFGGPGVGVLPYFNLRADDVYLTVDQFGFGTFNGWVQGMHVIVNAGTTSGPGPASLYVGSSGPTFGEYWNGMLAEFLVFDRRLSDAERRALEDFLARKYGIELYRS